MITFLLILIVCVAGYLWYKESKKDQAESTEAKPAQPEAKPAEPVEEKPAEPVEEKPAAPKPPTDPEKQIIWQDWKRKLWMEGGEAILMYNGERYTFSCQPYEPMAIILKKGEAVVYIHNAFDVAEECRCFLRKPDYQCCTITGEHHDAERFCLLLTTAIDGFYECQENEVELKLFDSHLRMGRKDYRYQNTNQK